MLADGDAELTTGLGASDVNISVCDELSSNPLDVDGRLVGAIDGTAEGLNFNVGVWELDWAGEVAS